MKRIFKGYGPWKLSHNVAPLILRVVLGAGMLFGHGLGKLDTLLGSEPIKFPDPFGTGVTISLGLAVFAEVICSALILAGLFTRIALIPLIITMAVAYFVIHGSDNFAVQEKALLYGAGYLALFFTGPGRISIDGLIGKK